MSIKSAFTGFLWLCLIPVVAMVGFSFYMHFLDTEQEMCTKVLANETNRELLRTYNAAKANNQAFYSGWNTKYAYEFKTCTVVTGGYKQCWRNLVTSPASTDSEKTEIARTLGAVLNRCESVRNSPNTIWMFH